MATLSTLGALMSQLGSTQLPQYDPIQVMRQQQALQGDRTGNATALLTLQDLQRQQADQAALRQFIQANPEALLGGGGLPQSTLGSLQGPPGAITQTPLPGMPGQAQTVPAPQDLSQFASGQPPQSTLGQLAPPQRPDPLRALIQQSPEAALKLMDTQYKVQERVLGMREKYADYIARAVQGATDQASWDAARQEIARLDPQGAAQLHPQYSPQVRDQVVQRALSAKDALTLQVQDLQAQAAVIKARREGRSTDVDNQLRAMGVQPGQETPAQMREALDTIQRQKLEVSGAHGTGQIVQSPQGFMRINPRTNQPEQIQAPGGGALYPKPTAEEQRAASYGDRALEAHRNVIALEDKGFTPGFWNKVGDALPFGMGNYLQSEDLQKYRQGVSQFAQAILRKESGAAISPTEYEMTDKTYFPQPGDSKTVIEQKRTARESIITQLQEEGKQTGRHPTRRQQTSQAPTGGKVVSRAALHAEADRRGVPREQAEQQAKAKGYEVR